VFVQGSLVNDFPFCELLQIKVITFTFWFKLWINNNVLCSLGLCWMI
jgi:hypothetical protein